MRDLNCVDYLNGERRCKKRFYGQRRKTSCQRPRAGTKGETLFLAHSEQSLSFSFKQIPFMAVSNNSPSLLSIAISLGWNGWLRNEQSHKIMGPTDPVKQPYNLPSFISRTFLRQHNNISSPVTLLALMCQGRHEPNDANHDMFSFPIWVVTNSFVHPSVVVDVRLTKNAGSATNRKSPFWRTTNYTFR